MKQRCFNPKNHGYKDYGGRGIKVCDEWLNPEPFLKWALENGYKKGLTIERIDNDGDYEPANCRWATQKEQKVNHRRNRHFEINGEKMVLTYWCERYNINMGTVRARLSNGMDILDALTIPVGQTYNKRYSVTDKIKTKYL